MRQSILSRQLKPPSRINDETSEAEHEKEVLLLNARQSRVAATESFLRSLHPADNNADPHVKLKLFESNKHALEEHRAYATVADESEKQFAEQLRQDALEVSRREEMRFTEANDRRRSDAKRIMEENKRLAEERNRLHSASKSRDVALDRENLRILESAHTQRRLR